MTTKAKNTLKDDPDRYAAERYRPEPQTEWQVHYNRDRDRFEAVHYGEVIAVDLFAAEGGVMHWKRAEQ